MLCIIKMKSLKMTMMIKMKSLQMSMMIKMKILQMTMMIKMKISANDYDYKDEKSVYDYDDKGERYANDYHEKSAYDYKDEVNKKSGHDYKMMDQPGHICDDKNEMNELDGKKINRKEIYEEFSNEEINIKSDCDTQVGWHYCPQGKYKTILNFNLWSHIKFVHEKKNNYASPDDFFYDQKIAPLIIELLRKN